MILSRHSGLVRVFTSLHPLVFISRSYVFRVRNFVEFSRIFPPSQDYTWIQQGSTEKREPLAETSTHRQYWASPSRNYKLRAFPYSIKFEGDYIWAASPPRHNNHTKPPVVFWCRPDTHEQDCRRPSFSHLSFECVFRHVYLSGKTSPTKRKLQSTCLGVERSPLRPSRSLNIPSCHSWDLASANHLRDDLRSSWRCCLSEGLRSGREIPRFSLPTGTVVS